MKKFVYRFKISFLATFLVALSMVGRGQDLPQILLIQPSEPNIKWLIGSTQWVSWTDNFTYNVKVMLKKYGGAPDDTLNLTGVAGVPGSTFQWTINPAPLVAKFGSAAGLYTIYVRSIKSGGLAETTISESENPFELVTSLGGEIKVLQPDIADIKILTSAKNYWISWTDNLAEPVDVYLVNGTASPTVEYKLAGPVNGSTWIWSDVAATIAAAGAASPTFSINTSDYYRIKVISSTNPALVDESDNDFQFVTTFGGNFTFIQPYGGEIWRVGTEHLISWIDNLDEFVTLELWRDDVPGLIESYTTTHKWASTRKFTMPGTAGTYKFKIYSTLDAGIFLWSEPFYVVENLGSDISVIQPYGGEVWLQNTTHLISWTDNLTETVDILLVNQAGTFTQTIFTNVVGTTKSWNLKYPGTPGGTIVPPDFYKIIVKSHLYSTQAMSEDWFEIAESLGGEIIMIQPNVSGIQWALGSQHLISWTDNFPGNERIGIDLVKLSGGTWTITTNVPGVNPTTYTWTIPLTGLTPASDYKIRVYRVNPSVPAISTISEEPFTLWEPLDKLVIYPNPCDQSTAVQFANEDEASYTVNLYDRFGTLVLQKSINTSDTKELNIPTSQLPNGIYFLNTTSKDSQTVNSKKIVIQH